ncbi:MAG: ABC transporter permease [Planctomycetes bacterium]|nr:ABC transporter permease [Planctomycetota bacterium]
MLREIWTLRHFWLALARHDLKDRYRRSILGIAWSLLKPAGITLILTLVFANVFHVPVHEYAPFLFLGIITWQFLNESVVQGCNSFRLGSTYLRVRPVPIAIFPLRVVLSAGIHASIGLVAALMLIWYLHGIDLALVLLSLIPAIIVLTITAWSLACICGILHTRFADTQQIAEISLQALFYATPVIYLPESLHPTGWLYMIVACNPFAAMLELVRRPLLHGEPPSVQAVMVALAFMSVTAIAAWLAVRRVERRMVLWL